MMLGTGARRMLVGLRPRVIVRGGLLRRASMVGGLIGACCLIGASGALAAPAFTPVSGSPFSTGTASVPGSVAFSAVGGLLASADTNTAKVSVFSVNTSTGALTQVTGSPFSTDSTPTGVAFSPSGGLLATANQGGNNVSVFSVNPSTHAVTQVPGSPFALTASGGGGPQPESVAFSPSGLLLATADNGSGTVSVFSVDPSTGALTQVTGSPFVTGGGPASVAFSPGGGLLATANTVTSNASVFSVNASTGLLTPVTGSPFSTGTGSTPYAVAFSPSGGLLATANYGTSNVSVFAVNASTGLLTAVTGSPFTSGTGSTPLSVAFSPSGGLLATANTGTSNLSVFTVGPPIAQLSSAVGGQTYVLNQSVATSFACIDATGAPGISSCTDSNSASSPSGALDTSTLGAHPYTITATSTDGQTDTITISYTVVGPPTATITAPADSQTYNVNQVVATSFSCADSSGAPGISSCTDSHGASGSPGTLNTTTAGTGSYTVTATSNDTQTATTTISYTVLAPPGTTTPPSTTTTTPPIASGPAHATGWLRGAALGLIRLGMTRARANSEYAHSSTRGQPNWEFFPLTPIGVRAGYASTKLLKTLSSGERNRVRGRIILLLTANPFYALDGVRPGDSLHAAAKTLHTGHVIRVGLNDWYMAPNGSTTAIIKVRSGIVQEIGTATKMVTQGRTAQLKFITSFS